MEMDSEFRICPDCFTQNEIDAQFCNNCGFNFQDYNKNDFEINVFYNIDDLIDDAVLVYEGENYEESLQLIDSFLEITPENSYAWSFKAHVLNKLGFIKDSITCCDIALNIDDMSNVAWSSKAYFYFILKNYDASLTCCESYLILDSQNQFINQLKESILNKISNEEW